MVGTGSWIRFGALEHRDISREDTQDIRRGCDAACKETVAALQLDLDSVLEPVMGQQGTGTAHD
jgi:hypothetical protein